MKKENRKNWIVGGLLAVVVALAIWFLSPGPAPPSVPSSGYYSGPMRSKHDPNAWITADGRRVPAPPDAIPYSPSGSSPPTPPGTFPSDDLPSILPPGLDGTGLSGTPH